MLKDRVISALIGIPLIIGILYAGGIWWQLFFILLGIIGLYEIYKMMYLNGLKPLFLPGYLFMFLLFFHGRLDYINFIILITLILIITIIWCVVNFSHVKIDSAALSIFSALYIGLLLSYSLKIASFNDSFTVMLLAFILTWSTDMGGYFFGKKWGKHKMTPVLSPKKTWEGALGGIFLSVLAVFIFFAITSYNNYNYFYIILLGIMASISAQFGDLFASSIKRYFAVKDAGHIIPGHGGVMDRFDSFMLVLPVVYYFFYFLNIV